MTDDVPECRQGWCGRVGVVTPHFDLIPEFELAAMAPAGISIHAARAQFGVAAGARLVGAAAVRAFAAGPGVDDAVELLAAAPLEAIVYGFTSSSYVDGAAGDATLQQRLEARAGGVPVVVPCRAAVAALEALGARRLALIHPPWFPDETDALGGDYFRRAGFEVAFHAPATIAFDELPAGQLGVDPGVVCDWVRARVPAEVDAVFIGGNGFRATAAVGALERALERPVLTANQVALWQALARAGLPMASARHGRLFALGAGRT
ncbi:maleate cis-trans isomerase family protein [Halomonas koreensis]|uniref:Maleate isomerase n=1 Tax=Halomonas koreensis TaxID=245385 RepID=A0ABU1FXC4_9GAMM|nr:hypothetical protein [Halomonas koreensis]MDR5865333.1 hypothetical protein [Halomonas koreensis]